MDKNTFRNPHVIHSNLTAGLSWVLKPLVTALPAAVFHFACPTCFTLKKAFFQLLPLSCKDSLNLETICKYWEGETPFSVQGKD